jgi:hypothetical protein
MFFDKGAFGQIEIPIGAPVILREIQLHSTDWPKRRTTQSLLKLDVVRVLLYIFKEESGQTVTIRYPGGDEGNAWGVEFQEWLVSLGLPSRYVVLEPGSGGIDRLLILVESLSVEFDAG